MLEYDESAAQVSTHALAQHEVWWYIIVHALSSGEGHGDEYTTGSTSDIVDVKTVCVESV